MPGTAKADIKFGFWIGVGLMLLALVAVVLQMVLAKARSQGA
jgi:tetrahydromethanopterin S-methyltransferase subunit B